MVTTEQESFGETVESDFYDSYYGGNDYSKEKVAVGGEMSRPLTTITEEEQTLGQYIKKELDIMLLIFAYMEPYEVLCL